MEEGQSTASPSASNTFLGYGIGYEGRKPIGDQFITTRFLIVRYVRVIPLGSYRATDGKNGILKIGARVPLQWDQVWLGMRLSVLMVVIGLAIGALTIYFENKK
jgi:hypothetical protein